MTPPHTGKPHHRRYIGGGFVSILSRIREQAVAVRCPILWA